MKMIVSFMILENDIVLSKRLKEIIERRLTEELRIEVRVMTASFFSEAMNKGIILADIHLVDIDLLGGLNYIKEVVNSYPEDQPAIPVIVTGSHNEEFGTMMELIDLRVTGYIKREEKYDEEQVMKYLKRAVKCFKRFDDKTVTFSRSGNKRTYKERNIWCIQRLPHGQKRIMVTIYDEFSNELIEEEFTVKNSLTEVPKLFSAPNKMIRCHQSWLVNPRVIVGETRKELILISGLQIPFGEKYTDSLKPYIG